MDNQHMNLNARMMRERTTTEGIIEAFVEKHVNEFRLALQFVWENPSENRYVSKRIWSNGMPEVHFTKGLEDVRSWFKSWGYEVIWDQGNLMTLRW